MLLLENGGEGLRNGHADAAGGTGSQCGFSNGRRSSATGQAEGSVTRAADPAAIPVPV